MNGNEETVECTGCLDTIYLHKAHRAKHGWLCHGCWQEHIDSDLFQFGQDLVRGSVEILRMQND